MEKAFEPYVDGSTNTVIKVVGVGGAGGNALNTMVTKLTDCQVEFIAANTDRQALTRSLASEKISLGRTGLGAGARPEVGFQAANDAREEIAEKLRGADMVFITAGMGGRYRYRCFPRDCRSGPGTGYFDGCRSDKALLL